MLDAFIRVWLWPFVIAGSVAGFVAAFGAGWGELALLPVPAATIAVLLGLEYHRPRDARLTTVSDPELPNDLAHSVLGGALGPLLGNALFLAGAMVLAASVSDRFGGNLWPLAWPLWAQVVLAIVLSDGLEYWRHRWLHRVAWLWPTHALHHGSDRLHVMKSGRGHVLDFGSRGLLVVAPLVVLGAPPALLLAYPAAITVLGPISHANLDVRLPDWLHYLVQTPQIHAIHHARDTALSDSNFAPVLPAWDLLFGTFRHPREARHPAIGIEGDPLPRSFWRQLLVPFTPLGVGRG